MPYLEDLYEATRQNVQLAVRDGHEVVYVERLAHPEAVRVFSRVGGRMPLHATGVGQVLLAFAHASVQEEVLAGPLTALTPRTVTDPHALRRILAARAPRGRGGLRRDGRPALALGRGPGPRRGRPGRRGDVGGRAQRGRRAAHHRPGRPGRRPRDLPGPGLAAARRRPSGVVTPLPTAAGAGRPAHGRARGVTGPTSDRWTAGTGDHRAGRGPREVLAAQVDRGRWVVADGAG